ncbi:MAG: hypothetical protein V4667_04990 [Bacteroidota bacterium]
MVVLILIISAFLLIYSFSVLKNAKRKSSGQIRKSNGLFLFCLTGIVLCGIVILGENNPSNKEKLNIGEYTVEVDKKVETISQQALNGKKNASVYSNDKLEFLLFQPSIDEFNAPTKTSYLESFLKEMLFETRDNNLNAFLRFRSNKALLNCLFKSYELNTTKDIAACAIPLHKSGLFSHLLQFSYSIQFNNKVKTKIELTDKSSLPFENLMQLNDTTSANADSVKIGYPDVKEFQFQSYLNVIVFEKKNSKGENQKINGANFLLMGANSLFQNIEKIVSNENHMLLCGNLTFKNVLIDGKQNNLVINRWFRLIDTETKLYVIEMAHSPQYDKENKSWLELKKSFESFKLITKL